MSSRLSQLQKLIQESELDGYLVPTTDEHLNEYVPLHDRSSGDKMGIATRPNRSKWARISAELEASTD